MEFETRKREEGMSRDVLDAVRAAIGSLRSICEDEEQRAQDRIAAAKALLDYGGEAETGGLTVRVEGMREEWKT